MDPDLQSEIEAYKQLKSHLATNPNFNSPTKFHPTKSRMASGPSALRRKPSQTDLKRKPGSKIVKKKPLLPPGIQRKLPLRVHRVKEPGQTVTARDVRPPSPVVLPTLANLNKTEILKLLNIVKKPAFTAEDQFNVLEARDRLIRAHSTRSVDITAQKIQGTCPDMCPEKERLMRDSKFQVAYYEQNADGSMNYNVAIKQYSRSSADQEIPLAHEMRPVGVLTMTMSYLLHKIMDLCDSSDANLAEWYHFIWDRTRGIRKDLTIQDTSSMEAVQLVEQCARFHIHCFARLAGEDPSVFDEKINTENLTKCLQTLKYMYEDLALKGITCPNEAEFRAYVILMNLMDSNFLWEVQRLRPEIQAAPPIRYALKIFNALDTKNYVRFFKIVKAATYLNACLLLRYFNTVRYEALTRIIKAHSISNYQQQIPYENFQRILGFEDVEGTIIFLRNHGLQINRANQNVCVDRATFTKPEVMYTDRAYNLVESKRVKSVGETVCGGDLPVKSFETHRVHCSFDEHGMLRRSDIDTVWMDGTSNFAEVSEKRGGKIDEEITISDSDQSDDEPDGRFSGVMKNLEIPPESKRTLKTFAFDFKASGGSEAIGQVADNFGSNVEQSKFFGGSTFGGSVFGENQKSGPFGSHVKSDLSQGGSFGSKNAIFGRVDGVENVDDKIFQSDLSQGATFGSKTTIFGRVDRAENKNFQSDLSQGATFGSKNAIFGRADGVESADDKIFQSDLSQGVTFGSKNAIFKRVDRAENKIFQSDLSQGAIFGRKIDENNGSNASKTIFGNFDGNQAGKTSDLSHIAKKTPFPDSTNFSSARFLDETNIFGRTNQSNIFGHAHTSDRTEHRLGQKRESTFESQNQPTDGMKHIFGSFEATSKSNDAIFTSTFQPNQQKPNEPSIFGGNFASPQIVTIPAPKKPSFSFALNEKYKEQATPEVIVSTNKMGGFKFIPEKSPDENADLEMRAKLTRMNEQRLHVLNLKEQMLAKQREDERVQREQAERKREQAENERVQRERIERERVERENEKREELKREMARQARVREMEERERLEEMKRVQRLKDEDEAIKRQVSVALNDVIEKVIDQDRTRRLAQIARRLTHAQKHNRLLAFARKWRGKTMTTIEKRKLIENTPVWLSSTAFFDDAKDGGLEVNLIEYRQYRQVFRKKLQRLRGSKVRELDLMDKVLPMLSQRCQNVNGVFVGEIFWKVVFHEPRDLFFGGCVRKVLKECFPAWNDDGVFLETFCGQSTRFNVEMAMESSNDTHDVIFFAINEHDHLLNLKSHIKTTLTTPKHAVFILQDTFQSDLTETEIVNLLELEQLIDTNHLRDYLILINQTNNATTMRDLIESSLIYLACNATIKHTYEMDYFPTIFHRFIRNVLHQIEITCVKRDLPVLDDPNALIDMYNEAIVRLSDLFDVDFTKIPTISRNLERFRVERELPNTYEYFPDTIKTKDHLVGVFETLERLILPRIESRDGLRNYVMGMFNDEKFYLRVLEVLTRDKRELITSNSWIEIVRLIVDERVKRIEFTRLVVYDKCKLSELETELWFLKCDVVRERLRETFGCVTVGDGFDEELAVLKRVSERRGSEECGSDAKKRKVQFERLRMECEDLERSMEITKRTAVLFDRIVEEK